MRSIARCVLPVLVGPRTATRRGAARSITMKLKVRYRPPESKSQGDAGRQPSLMHAGEAPGARACATRFASRHRPSGLSFWPAARTWGASCGAQDGQGSVPGLATTPNPWNVRLKGFRPKGSLGAIKQFDRNVSDEKSAKGGEMP